MSGSFPNLKESGPVKAPLQGRLSDVCLHLGDPRSRQGSDGRHRELIRAGRVQAEIRTPGCDSETNQGSNGTASSATGSASGGESAAIRFAVNSKVDAVVCLT